jgi:hypothetical protein
MQLCPVSLAIGCAKCPIFKACPLKGVIGDYAKPEDSTSKKSASADSGRTPKK